MRVIEFAGEMRGFENRFNTVRLGVKQSKLLVLGETIGLLDKKQMLLFGTAVVEKVLVGKLGEMAALHARYNHNQKGFDVEGAPARMIGNMLKLYGPHIVNENKLVTVIYLKRVKA